MEESKKEVKLKVTSKALSQKSTVKSGKSHKSSKSITFHNKQEQSVLESDNDSEVVIEEMSVSLEDEGMIIQILKNNFLFKSFSPELF
eukprot:CAMPEP_0170531422 /NCGR_PEP_ID=MMETSP0209-20121228/61664_1 /TAXON_ID=665100 ORGANISM="Litonotus pictus, Strain P1" /NCGR_SAMPLE_ID=MMETSP0209 /ASSEMBLY_ACC=CAM_ASM_000301 /LENGTH=87 /DNA_ID=CAMNT_0010826033 /DNA_START=153 /DNA_END=413 /DNA_ORIENTATION=+